MSGIFGSVLVPVEFESANLGGLGLDRGAAVGDQEWLGVAATTVRALGFAAALAQGGEVYIVHATPDFHDFATWMTPARIGELDRDASRDSTTVLARIAERHCKGVSLRYVIEPGKPLDVILAAAREHAVDAIVMAASARRLVDRAFLGSTTDKVIRRSPCPVLVVPA